MRFVWVFLGRGGEEGGLALGGERTTNPFLKKHTAGFNSDSSSEVITCFRS